MNAHGERRAGLEPTFESHMGFVNPTGLAEREDSFLNPGVQTIA